MLVRLIVTISTILLMSGTSAFAWLFDAGRPAAGAYLIKDDGANTFVAAPFQLQQDSMVTSIGAALARAYGPTGAGITMYLAPSKQGLPDSALASWTLVPLNTTLTYYYTDLAMPIELKANTPYALVFASNNYAFAGSIAGAGYGYYAYNSSDYGNTWNMLYSPVAIRIDGYAVPEPASVFALTVGIIFVGSMRRRQKR